MILNKYVAYILWFFIDPKHSTLKDNDTITMGYGKMQLDGTFKYNIPPVVIKKVMNISKWSEINL